MLTCSVLPQRQQGCKGFAPHCTNPNPGPSHPILEGQEGRLQKSCALDWRDRMALGSPARPHRC